MPERNAHTEDAPRRRWLRIGAAVLAGVAVLAVAVLGWRWHRSIPVRRVVVEGTERAAPGAIRRLARVRAGQALYQIRPRLVADRAERHPWVESATVSRSPDGTLRLRVAERAPAALVMQDGEAAYYLDADGYLLPLPADSTAPAFDVPLVRGLAEDFHPVRPTSRAALRALLAALHDNAAARALVSEIRASAGGEALRLRTVPDGRGQSAEVRLGTGAFPEKLRRLTAFWRQAVKEKPRTAFHQIDLRFDGQIVARQRTLPPPNSTD